MELAEKTGATIYTSHLAPVQYPHHAARDQDLVSLDGAHIRILETPGHSPDSLSFVLEEGAPEALFTGDLLFVGDVGRPDLRDADADPTSLAGQLYDSLFQKVLQLPETVECIQLMVRVRSADVPLPPQSFQPLPRNGRTIGHFNSPIVKPLFEK